MCTNQFMRELSVTNSWHTGGQNIQKVLPSCVLRSSADSTLQKGIIASIRLIASAASGDSDVSFSLPLCRSENLEVNLKSIVSSPFLASERKFFIISHLRESLSFCEMGR